MVSNFILVLSNLFNKKKTQIVARSREVENHFVRWFTDPYISALKHACLPDHMY